MYRNDGDKQYRDFQEGETEKVENEECFEDSDDVEMAPANDIVDEAGLITIQLLWRRKKKHMNVKYAM